MKRTSNKVRDYMIQSLALSMVMVIWMLCIDAKLYGTVRILKVILSMMAFGFLFCFLERVIRFKLENYLGLSICVEFLVIVILFFIFGITFGWYHEGKEWLFLLYAIPIYIAGYALRLVGIRKDASDINKHLEES